MKNISITMLLLILIGVNACKSKIKCNCAKENVCVTIVNSTGQPLKTVKILSHGFSEAAIEQLPTNDKACLSFKSPGENSFSLIVILSNGKTITSREEYSEGGYKFTGTVTKDEIKITHDNIY